MDGTKKGTQQKKKNTSGDELLGKVYGAEQVPLPGLGIVANVKRVPVRAIGPVLGVVKDIYTNVVMKVEGPMAELLVRVQAGDETAQAELAQLDIKGIVLDALVDIPQRMIELFPLLSDVTQEHIDNMDAADGLALAAKIIEVNYDFFVQRVLPILRQLSAHPALAGVMAATTK